MSKSDHRRILIVTDLWTTHPNGPATVVRNLKRELEKRGHHVDLVEPKQFFTIPFPFYPEVRLPLFAGRRMRRIIVEGNYNDIHLATEGILGWYSRRACLKNRIPFTTMFNGMLDLYAENWIGKPAGALVKFFLTRFHRASALIFTATPAVAEHVRLFGLNQVRVSPLGVDPIFFSEGTCPATLQKPVFMYFGRVSSEKSVEEFLRLSLPGTKLVIGDGPDRKKLQREFPEVRFVGSQTGKPLIDWLACADVFVMPSRTETFGLVIVESLAAGVPVAAHDVTGPRDIIVNGINGYLDEDLGKAAQICLNLSREACRESVRKYSWEAYADRFLEGSVEIGKR